MKELIEIHSKCHAIFRQSFFHEPNDPNSLDIRYYGPSNACRIYDKLTDGEEGKTDCIGENFNQLSELIIIGLKILNLQMI